MAWTYANVADRQVKLHEAHKAALKLLTAAEGTGLFRAGITEFDLSQEIQDLAKSMFGPLRHWHKRIVRAGANTLLPYAEDPPNTILEPDSIFFVDLGPVFQSWESDIGRTYVLGDDARKIRIKSAVEAAWLAGRDFFRANRASVTGADMYDFAARSAKDLGYEFGGWHSGHLIGNFPHEVNQGDAPTDYLHPRNHTKLCDPDMNGNPRTWIYEVHFVDAAAGYGGFFEQWLEVE